MTKQKGVHEEEEDFHFSGLVFGDGPPTQGDLVTLVERAVDLGADGGANFACGGGEAFQAPGFEMFL